MLLSLLKNGIIYSLLNLFKKPSRATVYLPALLWAGFIFYLSSQPTLPSAQTFVWDFAFKKLAHMFVYFVLFRLVYRAALYEIKNPIRASIIAFLFTFLYSLSDEYHQSFIPGRTSTGKDILFDVLGMGIAWLSIFKYI